MKLLLIEDDQQLTDALQPLLREAGYAVEVSHDGIDGEFLGNELQPDLIVLDLGLPGKNGLDVLRSWRNAGNRTPVLVLTARDAWHERVDGLKAGADDYLGKPFHSQELLARLEAIARRHGGQASNALSWRGVTLDTERQQATAADGRTIELTAIEFRLLRYLMQHPKDVHSKTRLSEHVYEEEQQKDSNVIEVYINRLRQYFGKDFIETRRGQGYQLAADTQA
ncbi:response regulator transcription factor [Thalassolituus hydrocarboniclasticus]|uniref:Response regulator transcription factor n=1 Tax=Thalassolituus hydrocarboniclasticus TaxID=2742796 RepID=A0ABY6AF47_9GAMM|nr:response regulator transcription factor [Thalassolituus hydrocarboniclasticus]UXD89240.1 response regulator transcription factor [Thalassolituus hydrocarboniclasticus]